MTLFPSAGPVLVMARERPPSETAEKRTFVRTARKLSEKFGGTPLLIRGLVIDESNNAGTIPRNERPRCCLISMGLLIRLSTYSKKKAMHIASMTPPIIPNSRFFGGLGLAGRRGLSAASTTRMLLDLSSPEIP